MATRSIVVKTDPADARFIIVANESTCNGETTSKITARMCKCTVNIEGCDQTDTCYTGKTLLLADANGTTTIHDAFAELHKDTIKSIGTTAISDNHTLSQICDLLKILVGAIVAP